MKDIMLKTCQSWVGRNEKDGSHKFIIDLYNSQKNLPMGYRMKYSDPWCAAFVTAAAVHSGLDDIFPCECSCPRMIAKLQKMGCWDENDSRTPNRGDLVFYDWDASDVGDCVGSAEHVGIVEKVMDDFITVIEGNYHDSVSRRTLQVDGRYIRGYGIPRYNESASVKPYKPTVPPAKPTMVSPHVHGLALEVIRGNWGNGAERVKRICNAVQQEVNRILEG